MDEMNDPRFDRFVQRFTEELKWRYDACEDFAATPSSILLAVLNAVAEASKELTSEDK